MFISFSQKPLIVDFKKRIQNNNQRELFFSDKKKEQNNLKEKYLTKNKAHTGEN